MKYLLLVPTLVFCALFVLWPLGEMVAVSLTKTNYITSVYVGLGSFKKVLTDASFLRSGANSALYIMVMVPATVVCSLGIALLAFNVRQKWQNATRIIVYIPILSAGIIIAQFWKWVFHYDGVLNWIVSLFGAEPVRWWAYTSTAVPAIAMIAAMSTLGVPVIVLLAAMIGISQDVLDAARIDGATNWQTKWRVIIPMVRRMILVIAFLALIAAPQIFETVYALAPYEHSATLGYRIYQEAFIFGRHGRAAAMSLLLLVAMVGFGVAQRRLQSE